VGKGGEDGGVGETVTELLGTRESLSSMEKASTLTLASCKLEELDAERSVRPESTSVATTGLTRPWDHPASSARLENMAGTRRALRLRRLAMNTSTDSPSEASTDRTMTPTAARGILAVR